MGIDFTCLETILLSLKYLPDDKKKCNVLTLGRQGIHINQNTINYLFTKYNLNHIINTGYHEYSENLFNILGFDNNIDSIDYSNYEGATIIHDMNKPINITKKYKYILDGGTIEHIFNMPQVMENIINLLEIDGIFCSVTCNNNFSGHGIYQFSPEFFLSSLNSEYGMEIKDIYIARVNSEYNEWINVSDLKSNSTGRNESKFNDLSPVYIITIAKKISNNRKNLITDSPQQYSYKNIDWCK